MLLRVYHAKIGWRCSSFRPNVSGYVRRWWFRCFRGSKWLFSMKTFRNVVLWDTSRSKKAKTKKNTTTSFYEKTVVVFFLFSKKSIFCNWPLELTPRPQKGHFLAKNRLSSSQSREKIHKDTCKHDWLLKPSWGLLPSLIPAFLIPQIAKFRLFSDYLSPNLTFRNLTFSPQIWRKSKKEKIPPAGLRLFYHYQPSPAPYYLPNPIR